MKKLLIWNKLVIILNYTKRSVLREAGFVPRGCSICHSGILEHETIIFLKGACHYGKWNCEMV